MPFRLAHLSDAHLGPLPKPLKRELIGKRLTGYLNWRGGRARTHDMDVLAALVADMQAQAPDHIAMTGDILNLALPAEFPLARAWLESLGAPDRVSFTPGNHDAYVRGAMPQLARTFEPFTTSDPPRPGEPVFPFLRRRGDVALIGLSSGVPTPPFVASGRLGRGQLDRLAAILDETGRAGLARIILIHHPPHRAGAPASRGLLDARRFERIVAACGAELILHGHNHVASVDRIAAGAGEAPVVGAPSCSSLHARRAAYHLFEIETGPRGFSITARARGLTPGGAVHIGDLGAIALATPRQPASLIA